MAIRPWSKRADELRETESPFHELTAWNEWLEAWSDQQSEHLKMQLDVLDNVPLFAAFCAACDETAELVTKGESDDDRDDQSKATG